MVSIHRGGLGSLQRADSRGTLLAVLAVAVALTAGCTSVANKSELVGTWDSKAVQTCGLLFEGVMQDELDAAVDSTIREVKVISAESGLDPSDDPNLVGAADSGYAALCLLPVDGKRYVFYQLEEAAKSGAISRY